MNAAADGAVRRESEKVKIIFHFIELIQWKFNFAFLSSRMLKRTFSSVRRSTHVCLFNFLLCQSFLFVRSLLYLKPVKVSNKHFSLLFNEFFPSRRERKKFGSIVTAMVLYWQIILTMLNGKWNWVYKTIAMWTNQGIWEGAGGVSRCVTWWRIMLSIIRNHLFPPAQKWFVAACDLQKMRVERRKWRIINNVASFLLPTRHFVWGDSKELNY